MIEASLCGTTLFTLQSAPNSLMCHDGRVLGDLARYSEPGDFAIVKISTATVQLQWRENMVVHQAYAPLRLPSQCHHN